MDHLNQYKKYDVEVLTSDDLWAQYGPKLPDSLSSPAQAASPYQWHRWGLYGAGALFTLVLHALLLGTMFLGTAGRPLSKPTPLTEGAAASSQNENASEFVSTLLLLNVHSITPPGEEPDESAYAELKVLAEQTQPAVILASLEPVKSPELSGSDEGTDEESPTADASGDAAGRAMLFGRYMGQIKARIERAWDYPATTSPDKFECKVQIKQNKLGEVQEITLQRCGNDPAWQMSLVQAIQRASPLSAPPNDSVFTELITISFKGQPTAQIVMQNKTIEPDVTDRYAPSGK